MGSDKHLSDTGSSSALLPDYLGPSGSETSVHFFLPGNSFLHVHRITSLSHAEPAGKLLLISLVSGSQTSPWCRRRPGHIWASVASILGLLRDSRSESRANRTVSGDSTPLGSWAVALSQAPGSRRKRRRDGSWLRCAGHELVVNRAICHAATGGSDLQPSFYFQAAPGQRCRGLLLQGGPMPHGMDP